MDIAEQELMRKRWSMLRRAKKHLNDVKDTMRRVSGVKRREMSHDLLSAERAYHGLLHEYSKLYIYSNDTLEV